MRKFTVYTLLQYWTQAAFEQWDGYRDGADRAVTCGLTQANYSTFSKKAKAVPFELFKQWDLAMMGLLAKSLLKKHQVLGNPFLTY
ncbi:MULTISPECIES: hypothetical protein [Paenibacillus]|uniref:Uncharacterized protein n=1 Tax=Paenibacillus alvei TaxID=44250 RepID=A0ABT4E5J1_PAEAL|nr:MULTISPECIES: hypothetical protein [Paenibacillus]EPY09877.1 transposase of IS5377-like element [Paenibacillus alvei A6-6i-x]MCY9529016.1 hypothetical protein [Paenibacillus alvei]